MEIIIFNVTIIKASGPDKRYNKKVDNEET